MPTTGIKRWIASLVGDDEIVTADHCGLDTFPTQELSIGSQQNLLEDEEVIKKILKHLGLWPVESLKVERERKERPPQKATIPAKTFECNIDYSSSQVHPDSEKWLYSDPEYPEAFSS
jgi:hypothetical protein